MSITIYMEGPYNRYYKGLTEEERTQAIELVATLEIPAYLYSDDDPTLIGLVQATPDQIAAFEQALGIATG